MPRRVHRLLIVLVLVACTSDGKDEGETSTTSMSTATSPSSTTTTTPQPNVSRGRLRPYPVQFGSVVLVADESGTFVDVTPEKVEDEAIYDAFFADRQHGWVGITDFGRSAGRVVRTVDGGRTWVGPGLEVGVHHSAGSRLWLHFFATRHGWAVGFAAAANGGGSLYRSTDGGRTWSEVIDAPLKGPVRFISPTHGWQVDEFGRGGLFESFDGGVTWKERSVKTPSGVSSSEEVRYALPIFSGRRGVLPAHEGDRVGFYETSNEGRTWRLATSVQLPGGSGAARVSAASLDVWWVVSGGGVLVTEDAGRSWQRRERQGLPEMVFDFEAGDARRAWAAGFDRGGPAGLYETTDGGATWRPAC